jgi:TrmH family RNA methyltransferase
MQNTGDNKKRRDRDIISSPSNSTVKHIKSLLQKKNRELHGQFIVEGLKMVSEALVSGFSIDMLVFSETGVKLQQEFELYDRAVHTIVTTDSVFKGISDTQTPQGVLAVVQQRKYDLMKAVGQEKSFLIILDGVKDPGNLGTIIRTVDAAGGDGVVLVNDCVDPYNPKAVRSTMGSIFRVPLFQGYDMVELIDKLDHFGYHTVTSHLEGSNVFDWQGGHAKTALVIGSESHGVSRHMTDAADSLVKIPMAGGAESLNASVAAGILIYEIFRKGMKMD